VFKAHAGVYSARTARHAGAQPQPKTDFSARNTTESDRHPNPNTNPDPNPYLVVVRYRSLASACFELATSLLFVPMTKSGGGNLH